MRSALLPLVLCAAAWAQSSTVEDLLFRARHAQFAQGDPKRALELYSVALQDKSLDAARQAAIHLRMARCWVDLGEDTRALGHLKPHIYDRDGVEVGVRIRAAELRDAITTRLPRTAPSAAERQEEQSARQARLFKEQLALARTALQNENDLLAFYYVQSALKIDPQSEQARAMAAELENRLSGVMDIVREPLKVFRSLSEAQIRTVARRAEALLRKALGHGRMREINLAEAAFRDAVTVIDSSEFASESDRLVSTRQRVVEHWRAFRRKQFGESRADPVLPEPVRRATPLADYLNHLQRVLDTVSAPEHEYRIIPVARRKTDARSAGVRSPDRFTLLTHIESRWTPAQFARLHLPRVIHPESWRERGNFLETVGTMLVARNRPGVLDTLEEAVARVERPDPIAFRTRFLFVSVPVSTLPGLTDQFGEFERSELGTSPLLFKTASAKYSLDYLCSHLRDGGVDVRLDRDLFEVMVENASPQTLFAGVKLRDGAPAGAPALAGHYGLLLDLFPLRVKSGRASMALRLTSRLPLPSLLDSGARFLTQEGALFTDVEPGGTLVVAGVVDPFTRGDDQRCLLLLWENPPAPRGTVEPPPSPTGVEISLRNLLLRVQDHPGPRRDERRGFVRRDGLDVLAERSRFLESILRERLKSPDVHVDSEAAVVRVPPTLRESAERWVSELERECEQTYVVRLQVRSVRTPVFQRWIEREGLRLSEFGKARVALSDAPSGEVLLRNLYPAQLSDDICGPRLEWPAMPVLGLQARHVLHARTRTSPAYGSDEELATGETRTVVEGLRVTVRPYTMGGNRLQAWVEVETAALQSQVEELVLGQAIPSYQTSVEGERAAGVIDLGNPTRPQTALICSIPHPTASTPKMLTELVVAVSVRVLP